MTETTFNDIFMNDVKMLKRDNLHLKLRVQELESDMETIKRMLKTIVIDKPNLPQKAIIIQRKWRIINNIKKNKNIFNVTNVFFKKWKYNARLLSQFKKADFITCAPINITKKEDTYTNYIKQFKKYEELNCEMRWDDTCYNNSVEGNLFAFVKSNGVMEIHLITKIGNTTNRESYWSARERNVVFLSKEYFTREWEHYKQENDYKEKFSLRGTQRLKYQ